MSAITVKELNKVFQTKTERVEALKNINLTIEAGDIYGIIGMSGAGKSTLVRCFNYLEEPDSGQVFVGGLELGTLRAKELRSLRQNMGMIFQHFNLLMQKNVIENVCFPLRLRGVAKADARKKARELLELVELSDKEESYPVQLSGGQKQRVAIARALASDPEILLCDEATSALDPKTTASILRLLKEINERLHITIVLITHQMSVVRQICHHVAIMEQGEIVEEGSVEHIFNHPKTPVAKHLILGEHSDVSLQEWTGKSRKQKEINEDKRLRLVFSENSAYEPVISNMVLEFGVPLNILKADTKNVGGIAKGELILGLPKKEGLLEQVTGYLSKHGIECEEVEGDVY